MAYKCGSCKKRVNIDTHNLNLHCNHCGSKVLYKERPTNPKTLKAE